MAGCYGKIPALGDFLSRNLPATFVEAWDGWLRRVMGACARRDDDWTELYLAAPIWRFLLAPGAVGETGRAGVLVPSIDRIGRCFPLTIATEIPEGMPPLDMLEAWDEGFERAEMVAIGAIGRALDPEAFVGRVAGLPVPPTVPGTAAPRHWTPPGTTPGTPPGAPAGIRTTGAPLDAAVGRGLAASLALPLLAAAPQSWSLWWHLDWEQRPATTALFVGLPPPEAAGAMLLGSWKEGGWSG